MGMGRAGGAFQNGVNNFRSQNPPQGGYNGKGGAAQQPQMGGMGGKGKGGAAQQPQGGFGGKGAGRYQPQVQQPQGGFGGKGGQQQNPYAQQYYQPQFQPETFNNPYARGGFGQQPQMGGMGGKGGQMGGMSDLGRLAQQNEQQGLAVDPYNAMQGGMGGKGGQLQAPPHVMRRLMQQQGTAGPGPDFSRFSNMMRGQPSGLAALAQPTATTQAATPAPEQPYMGNYLQ